MSVQTQDIKKIIEHANTMIDIKKLTSDTNLRDIGADSLDMMNIFLAIQEEFGVDIPEEQIEKLLTIDAICSYINSCTNKSK